MLRWVTIWYGQGCEPCFDLGVSLGERKVRVLDDAGSQRHDEHSAGRRRRFIILVRRSTAPVRFRLGHGARGARGGRFRVHRATAGGATCHPGLRTGGPTSADAGLAQDESQRYDERSNPPDLTLHSSSMLRVSSPVNRPSSSEFSAAPGPGRANLRAAGERRYWLLRHFTAGRARRGTRSKSDSRRRTAARASRTRSQAPEAR